MAKKKINKKKTKKIKRKGPKVVTVRAYPRQVGVSKKNPDGITIADQHPRHLKGTYLDEVEIESIVKSYDKKGIVYPAQNTLDYDDGDKYNELIAIWTDYFNKKFKSSLDPDMVKALIASESGFSVDPKGNPIAIGIAQITKSTHKILLDPKGEAKNFIFKSVSQKDLKNPNIAIPMAIRWLYRKRDLARHKLKREPNHEEIILEYKGWLEGDTSLKTKGLKNYREKYAKLKSKK